MFAVGAWVWVPNAFDMKWEPSLTQVKAIEGSEEEGNIKYIVPLCSKNFSVFNGGIERVDCVKEAKEVFNSRAECQNYVDHYYYDAYCRGCKYDDIAGTVWRCRHCSHMKKMPSEKHFAYDMGVCEFTGAVVWQSYTTGMELCNRFEPVLPQDKRDYVSWEHYEDMLRNCEYNQECPTHKLSAHKTCPYERFLHKRVWVAVPFTLGDKKVKEIQVTQKRWLDGSWYQDNKIRCLGIEWDIEQPKRGKRKETREFFDGEERVISLQAKEVVE